MNFTYLGLHDFGNDKIIIITIPAIAITAEMKKKNEHFRINGQFQCTNPGVSLVICIFKLAYCLVPFSCRKIYFYAKSSKFAEIKNYLNCFVVVSQVLINIFIIVKCCCSSDWYIHTYSGTAR